jgi:FSR family fosmidomycin resistance protein-like MFS transporter
MEIHMNKRIVGIYSIIHFIVDLACAILVSNLVTQKMGIGNNLFIAILIYNFFAFAVQLPIGIIADKINKNAICSAIGCLLVTIAFGFSNFGIISCIIAGIGNAMFHVGGGIDVLNISNRKATPSGIFVSTGAMGIFLGGKSDSIRFDKYFTIILILLICAILLFWLYNQIKDKVKNEKVIIPTININEMIAIVCLIVTVVIRGYVGLILSFEWKSNFILALLSILAVVFGKMLGGIIGDKIGFMKISLISLIVSAFLFIFAFNNSILGILAILFFNMTMPITLTALSNILFNNKGMAFGLLTFALFIGAVPVFFGYKDVIFTSTGLFFTTIISAIILYMGIKKYNTIMEKKYDSKFNNFTSTNNNN